MILLPKYHLKPTPRRAAKGLSFMLTSISPYLITVSSDVTAPHICMKWIIQSTMQCATSTTKTATAEVKFVRLLQLKPTYHSFFSTLCIFLFLPFWYWWGDSGVSYNNKLCTFYTNFYIFIWIFWYNALCVMFFYIAHV